jgi:ribosome maturation factor RimP
MIAGTPLEETIANLLAPVIEDLGFELVRIRMTGQGKATTLQIMAERPDGSMDVGGCEQISREASAILDVADPISGFYNLEVSSPGVDRPLTRLKDFINWAGFEVKVDLSRPDISGRRHFRGWLQGVVTGDTGAEQICLEGEDGQHILAYPMIARAKLVMNDDLMEQARLSMESSKEVVEGEDE